MRRMLTGLILAFGLASAAPAEAQAPRSAMLPESEQAAIQTVIEDQIAAFLRDDGDAAFAHASPTIQGMFGDAATFMAMVRDGYRPVYRPRSVIFEEVMRHRGHLIQPVRVVGPDGVPVIALYTMTKTSDGVWRIDGCVLVPLAESEA